MDLSEVITLQGGFAPVDEEISVELTEVQGEIPRDLHGMHVRNGPNRRFAAPGRYHWFDGDGMLHAVRFEGGRAFYQNRWVHTAGLTEETAAGQALWQGIKDPPRKDRPDMPLKTRPTPMSNTLPATCWPCGTWAARSIAYARAT